MNVLVTGGAGYIGSHTCVELLNRGYDVVVIDNLVNSSPKAIERVEQITGKKVAFYENDVRDRAALDRIFAILDTDTSLPEAASPVPKRDFADRIAFNHVSFRFSPEGPIVVDDASFELPRGELVALVGETGSGKTTYANLLARFYDPTSGSVTLDGIPLADIASADLRRLIGVVTQDTILFNDTIAANIAYGSPDATQADIEAAARMANAHDFIVAHPEGYSRVCGDKGFLLSGGEKQRIALARAILRNPPILILDEATSALDTVTERLVQEAISKVMRGRTTLAIAHRLSTVRDANLILVIEHGRIVESGTHDELYARGGRYRHLCDIQFGA
jgi:ABC-type multidrug transport system fused ATPase/permease subunit